VNWCTVTADVTTSALLLARRISDSIGNKSTTAVLWMVQILMAEDARNTEPSFRDSALQHLDGLYAYAMTLVRNQAEAEDLVQETYLRLCRPLTGSGRTAI